MRIAREADQSGALHHARPTAERDQFEELAGSWENRFGPTGTLIRGARLMSPLDPPVIYAIGLNYHDHAVETDARIPENPVIFMKNISAVIGLTGTPHGVGMARQSPVWLQPGDTVSLEIEGIGTLANPVVEAD